MRGYAHERDMAPLVAEAGFSRRVQTQRPTLGSGRLPPRVGNRRYGASRRTSLGMARRALDGVGGLGWSVIGFLLGAVFWHFVGFWSFVADVVLAGHPSSQGAASPQIPAVLAGDASTPELGTSVALASCTALVLDRATGVTSADGCSNEGVVGSSLAVKSREDRIADNASWPAPHRPSRPIAPRQR